MSDFDFESFLRENGISFKLNGAKTHAILSKCPSCGGANKFYINLSNGKFLCHKCSSDSDHNTRGGGKKLISLLLGIDYAQAGKILGEDKKFSQLEIHNPNSFNFNFIQNRAETEVLRDFKPIDLPSFFLKTFKNPNSKSYQYLISRGFDHSDIEKSQAMELDSSLMSGEDVENLTSAQIKSIKNKYEGRVIFPLIYEKKVYGLIARDFTGESKLKVLNSDNFPKSEFVWNLNNVKDSDDIIITEGITSAVKCGLSRSVATLGKAVSDSQLLKIAESGAKNAYVCLDPDAKKEAKELQKKLFPFFNEVKVIYLPEIFIKDGVYKDAGDYTKEEMEAFITSIKSNIF